MRQREPRITEQSKNSGISCSACMDQRSQIGSTETLCTDLFLEELTGIEGSKVQAAFIEVLQSKGHANEDGSITLELRGKEYIFPKRTADGVSFWAVNEADEKFLCCTLQRKLGLNQWGVLRISDEDFNCSGWALSKLYVGESLKLAGLVSSLIEGGEEKSDGSTHVKVEPEDGETFLRFYWRYEGGIKLSRHVRAIPIGQRPLLERKLGLEPVPAEVGNEYFSCSTNSLAKHYMGTGKKLRALMRDLITSGEKQPDGSVHVKVNINDREETICFLEKSNHSVVVRAISIAQQSLLEQHLQLRRRVLKEKEISEYDLLRSVGLG